MMNIAFFNLKDDTFEAVSSNGEVLYEKSIQDADDVETAGLMCALIAEGLTLKEICEDYVWSLGKAKFKHMTSTNAFIAELYAKSKMTRMAFLEEQIIEHAKKGEEEQVILLGRILKLLGSGDKTSNKIFNITTWQADKDDVQS